MMRPTRRTALALAVASPLVSTVVSPMPLAEPVASTTTPLAASASPALVPTVPTSPTTAPAVWARQSGASGQLPGQKGALASAAVSSLDIPLAAMSAYQRAASVMAEVDPECALGWTLLAAVGRIESDHGRYAGTVLADDGTTVPPIRGVALDGQGPFARIADTDAGLLDGDALWDRAVGPMQILPSTWSVVAVDADGDGTRSPDDIDDAALAAGVLLCAGDDTTGTPEGVRAALLRYNPSQAYVEQVLSVEAGYRSGGYDLAGTPTYAAYPAVVVRDDTTPAAGASDAAPGSPADGRGAEDEARDKEFKQTRGSKDGKTAQDGKDGKADEPVKEKGLTKGTPGGRPVLASQPTPSPTPTPTPTPEPEPEPEIITVTGLLARENGTWTVGSAALDLGAPAALSAPAPVDLDGDGQAETFGEELDGLLGTEITVKVVKGDGPQVVTAIEDTAYPGPAQP